MANRTEIAVSSVDVFNRQLAGYEASFESAGEVIDYQLYGQGGEHLAGGTGNREQDRWAMSKKFDYWDQTLLAEGVPFTMTVRVIRFATKAGNVIMPQATSDWLSLADAYAFVFPNKAA